jgi:hypothetical protein
VPVARPIADALNAPLDILMVRKIGVPWQPEVAAASVVDGEGAEIVTNDPVMRATGLDAGKIADLAKAELEEIERRRSLYLPGKEPVRAEGRTAILVDDGIATGTSMKAAILAVRKRRPARDRGGGPGGRTGYAARDRRNGGRCGRARRPGPVWRGGQLLPGLPPTVRRRGHPAPPAAACW